MFFFLDGRQLKNLSRGAVLSEKSKYSDPNENFFWGGRGGGGGEGVGGGWVLHFSKFYLLTKPYHAAKSEKILRADPKNKLA